MGSKGTALRFALGLKSPLWAVAGRKSGVTVGRHGKARPTLDSSSIVFFLLLPAVAMDLSNARVPKEPFMAKRVGAIFTFLRPFFGP